MNPWSMFWRQGHSTTFGEYFKQGYEGAVADWWRGIVATLPRDATVVEVACGNCSLLPVLVKGGMGARYVGVDLAAVAPSDVAAQGLEASGIEVTVHAETPIEAVPEPDGVADIVASVFGIEYSDLDRSVPEAARLLKPGGRFAALVHHADSVVTTMSKRAVGEYRADDIHAAIGALRAINAERDRLASLAELKSSPKAEQGRATINDLAQRYLSDTDPATANATMFEFMTHALKFFKLIGAPAADRAAFIDTLEAEHAASHERFLQMVSVGRDADGIEAMRGQLEGSGFTAAQSRVIRSGRDILAWELTAARST